MYVAKVIKKDSENYGREFEIKAHKFGGVIVILDVIDSKEIHGFIQGGDFEAYEKELTPYEKRCGLKLLHKNMISKSIYQGC